MKYTDSEVGKAVKAFQAYNHGKKRDRVKEFQVDPWVRVVRAVQNGTASSMSCGWSPARRKRFQETIAKRQQKTDK